MKKTGILLLTVFVATSYGWAKYADYDEEKPPEFGKGKIEIGILGAYSWNTGDHSRLGIAANGAGFAANVGYMFEPWLVFPEAILATSFTSARSEVWERDGYPEPASYIGYTGYQVGVGARVRTGSTSSKLWPYLSGGIAYFFGSRDAMTSGNLVMDSFKSKGPAFYAGAGVDMYVISEDWAAAVFDVRYMYSPQKWDERSGAPGLDRDFTLTEFRFNLGLRFFVL